MMAWSVISTETFSREFKKHRKDGEFVKILDNKIKRLQEDPENVGGYLSRKLFGYKSTRILKNLRLVFKIVNEKHEVHLMAIDHRKFGYERFDFD
jgi:mRNA-degrading endonuclease RelE of RelBE toxin-antitoxin system